MAEAKKSAQRRQAAKRIFGPVGRWTQIAAFTAVGGYALWSLYSTRQRKQTGRRCRRSTYDLATSQGFEPSEAVNRAYEYCGSYGDGIEPEGPIRK